jgi:hypothetical protein
VTLLLLLVAQAVGSAPAEQIVPAAAPRCRARASSNDEIVVCARRPDGPNPYRINQPPAAPSEPSKAEVQIARGVSAAAETEQADIGGFPSNRLLVRFKIKF